MTRTLQITVELDAEQVEKLRLAVVKRNILKEKYKILGMDLANAESALLDLQTEIAKTALEKI